MGKHARKGREIETEDYVAMLHRMTEALVARAAEDPAMLIHFPELEQHLSDARKMAIATANAAVAQGGHGYSLNELAAAYGATKQAMSKAAAAGRELLDERAEQRGEAPRFKTPAVYRVTSLRAYRDKRLRDAGILPAAGTGTDG